MPQELHTSRVLLLTSSKPINERALSANGPRWEEQGRACKVHDPLILPMDLIRSFLISRSFPNGPNSQGCAPPGPPHGPREERLAEKMHRETHHAGQSLAEPGRREVHSGTRRPRPFSIIPGTAANAQCSAAAPSPGPSSSIAGTARGHSRVFSVTAGFAEFARVLVYLHRSSSSLAPRSARSRASSVFPVCPGHVLSPYARRLALVGTQPAVWQA